MLGNIFACHQEEKVPASIAFESQASMSKEDASVERLEFGNKSFYSLVF